jgi:hypothetical protein
VAREAPIPVKRKRIESFLGAVLACQACTHAEAPSPVPLFAQHANQPAPEFVWTTIDGETLRSADLRGRATLLLFVTMHELGSQLMAQQAEHCLHKVVPRVNAVAVLMEGPEFASLAPAFREGLSLSYPLVMATPAMLRASSPFGEIDYLPTALVLDPEGKETERFRGPTSEAELERALVEARRN